MQYSGSVHKEVIRKQEINESEILVLHVYSSIPSSIRISNGGGGGGDDELYVLHVTNLHGI